jgi:hypothetical protein
LVNLEFRCHEIPVRGTQIVQGQRLAPTASPVLTVSELRRRIGHVELAAPKNEQKMTTGQLAIIRRVGFHAVWSIRVGAGRCVSALRR